MTRTSRLVRITLWGALTNLLLSVLKMVAGILGASAAMVADAIHSFSDLLSDGVVLLMVHLGGQDADKEHDFGHGKFETFGTLVVAILLIGVSISLCYHGIQEIVSILSTSQPLSLSAPSWLAFWAALASILVKEALFQWTYRVGKAMNSAAVMANAWHHRSDALSSIGALLGIGGAILLGGKWLILDPIVCIIIAIVIIVMAVKMIIPAVAELLDASLPAATENEIEQIALSIQGVEDVHELKTRRSGPAILASLHLVVDSQMTVLEAHDITIEVESALRAHFGENMQLSIHIEPSIDAK